MKQNQLMIYVHIPFCVRKCRYCDFLSFPGSRETQQAYIQALQREIKERYDYNHSLTAQQIYRIKTQGG